MTPRCALRGAIAGFLCCASLVACREDDDPASATESRSAGGYVFELPDGWRDITRRANNGPIKYDRVVEGGAGPAMNVSVVREQVVDMGDVHDLAASRAKQIKRSIGVAVRSLPHREIDGQPAGGQAFHPPTTRGTQRSGEPTLD